MPQWHSGFHKRKRSGGRRRSSRGKRGHERGSPPSEITLGEKRMKVSRGRGGNVKTKILSLKEVNVIDPETGKTQRAEIRRVVESPANRDYQKRGIITRGAVVETPLGRVKITSRPGQEGGVNAVLLHHSTK